MDSSINEYVFKNGCVSKINENDHFNYWILEGFKFRFNKSFVPIGLVHVTEQIDDAFKWRSFIQTWSTKEKINCLIVLKSYRFNVTGNTKAYAECKYSNTHRKFNFLEVPVSKHHYVVIMSDSIENIDHTNEPKKYRELRGSRREALRKLLETQTVRETYETVCDSLDNSLGEKGNTQTKTKLSVLQRLATEVKKKENTHCEVSDLAFWAQGQEFENIGEDILKYNAKGLKENFMESRFFRNGFKILLQHEGIVKLFRNVPKASLIMHYDASGGFVKKIKCHDHGLDKINYNYVGVTQLNGFTLNCAEMITNDHTAVSQCDLFNFMSEKCWLLPFKIIVTDFSWAAINAILKTINSVNIIEYLNFFYNMVVHNKVDPLLYVTIKVRLVLCCSHVMHSLSRLLNRHIAFLYFLKQFILQTFFIMLDSTDFNEVQHIFYDFCVVLLSEFYSDVLRNSLKRFKQVYRNETDASEILDQKFENIENADSDSETSNCNRENILFFKRFKSIMLQASNDVKNAENESSNSSLYHPEILKTLLNYYMPYIFLWSRFGYVDIHNKGRLNNGLVESYFAFQKNTVFKKNLNLPATEYILLEYVAINTVVKYCMYPSLYKDATRSKANFNNDLQKSLNLFSRYAGPQKIISKFDNNTTQKKIQSPEKIIKTTSPIQNNTCDLEDLPPLNEFEIDIPEKDEKVALPIIFPNRSFSEFFPLN